MTFAIGEILLDAAGRITILVDTKVTNTVDETATRHIYTRRARRS